MIQRKPFNVFNFGNATWRPAIAALLGCVIAATSTPAAPPPKLPYAEPSAAGMNADTLAQIDDEIEKEIAAKRLPGCVVLVARHGRIALLKAFGNKQLEPETAPMTADTVFDLASLTKPITTATSVMALVEQKKLGLDDRIAQYVPEFASNGKEQITVQDLLTHQGGLIADNALADYANGRDEALEKVFALSLQAEPRTKFIYSDVGFIVLGELVRRVSNKDVNQFSQEHVFRRLGMTDTGYLPNEQLRTRCAPTEQRGQQWLRGEVHDPRADRLGGIAGHAGLFSTAADLAVYGQMVLNRGNLGGVRVFERQTIEQMTTPVAVPRGYRALGWDVQTGYSHLRGKGMSAASFGHGGFTGTAIWIDPELDLFTIFLSNRLHPDGKGLVNPLIGRINSIVVDAIENPPAIARQISSSDATKNDVHALSDRPTVLTGIDVLERDGFAPLKGRRVGLITNHTGITRQGVSTVKLLHEAPGVTLVALFSPEHGLHGKLDVSKIPDMQDEQFDLPVYSLYGETRKPTAESLKGIDTLVFDIQDIGARFYTYPSTMGDAMRAAAEQGIRFIVLDRPNPINGVDVAGPVLDAGRESFVGYHCTAVRHGMTIGELARMFNEELQIGCNLHVVPVEGWRRSDLFDATGLPWVHPSPSMRNLDEALLYPGIGLLETTNLSVGRGTDTPFEIIGAPWLDAARLADALNEAELPGIRFVPTTFTPEASKFQDEECQGVQFVVTDARQLRPVRTGLEIAHALRRLHPNDWHVQQYDRLLASKAVLDAVRQGKPVSEIEAIYEPDLRAFKKRRERFLLY